VELACEASYFVAWSARINAYVHAERDRLLSTAKVSFTVQRLSSVWNGHVFPRAARPKGGAD
jgi:hypothetical protein